MALTMACGGASSPTGREAAMTAGGPSDPEMARLRIVNFLSLIDTSDAPRPIVDMIMRFDSEMTALRTELDARHGSTSGAPGFGEELLGDVIGTYETSHHTDRMKPVCGSPLCHSVGTTMCPLRCHSVGTASRPLVPRTEIDFQTPIIKTPAPQVTGDVMTGDVMTGDVVTGDVVATDEYDEVGPFYPHASDGVRLVADASYIAAPSILDLAFGEQHRWQVAPTASSADKKE